MAGLLGALLGSALAQVQAQAPLSMEAFAEQERETQKRNLATPAVLDYKRPEDPRQNLDSIHNQMQAIQVMSPKTGFSKEAIKARATFLAQVRSQIDGLGVKYKLDYAMVMDKKEESEGLKVLDARMKELQNGERRAMGRTGRYHPDAEQEQQQPKPKKQRKQKKPHKKTESESEGSDGDYPRTLEEVNLR